MNTHPNDSAQYHIFRDALVVHVSGRTVMVPKSDPRYAELIKQIAAHGADGLEKVVQIEDTKAVKRLLGF